MVRKIEIKETVVIHKSGEYKGQTEILRQYSDGSHTNTMYKTKKQKRKGKKVVIELEEDTNEEKEAKELVKLLTPKLAENFTTDEFVKDYLKTKPLKVLKMIKSRLKQGGKVEKRGGCLRLILHPKKRNKKSKNKRSQPYDLRIRG